MGITKAPLNNAVMSQRILKRSFAALRFFDKVTKAIAYMDVGEGRELGAEALPAKRVATEPFRIR